MNYKDTVKEYNKWHRRFSYNEMKMSGSYWHAHGCYISNLGTVRYSTGEYRDGPNTTLVVLMPKTVNERVFKRVYSEHGLKLICAKFLKDLNDK